MNLKQAKNLIQETFNNSFDRSKFVQFIKELLNAIDESKAQIWNKQYVKHDFHDGVKKYERIGTYTAPEGEKIDILIVYLEKETTLERARTLQRNFAAYHLKKRAEKDAGLVAFVSPNPDNWRFSLVKMEYHLEQTQEGKVKVEEDLTPAKRFSFIVGKNENSHTAQKQLLPILEDDKNNPTLKEIGKAFSIEAVTREFFNKYKDLFLNFKEEFDKILEKDKKITEDFNGKGINTADFAKKLLGQIVFLYFLQRKGWLGVDKNSNWGSGPKNFSRALFDKKYADYKNFFNDILEPLFYEALATDRGDKAYYSRFDCRIPFLNGGLFEPIQNYDWENTDIIIPNDLFSNDYRTKEGDIGSGILDFFDRYNFTIKEDEPLEKEVAIDPEMLGKVFENLLEIKDRKSKGAYYTPREIVHYMCQESLINYLATEPENKLPRKDIETFIHLGDFAVEHDMAKTQGIIKDDGKYKLPQSIHENAELIDKKLADITVCDPAIGSGAFPVGMMNEIVRARGALNATKTFKDAKSKRTPYSFKRHAIQNSLYGVDIDPGAVKIAKLRLWLSLVVDEEEMTEIKPLPNLDYKIMQGNSLLEEYEGIKLFDESLILDSGVEKKKRQEEIGKKKSALQQEYFKLHSEGKLIEIRKSEIEKEMKALQKEESALTKVETGGNSSLFDQESIAKKKAEELNRLHKEFFDIALKSNKAEIKKQIDELEWELIEETLKEHGKEKELPKLQALRRSNNKPFFLWKLHFAEVFLKKGGFDVVIGNPPYIRQEGIKELKSFLENTYECFEGRADLYVYFYERGVNLLNKSGVLSFISSNKFFRAGYGEGLRSFLGYKTQLQTIIDFGDMPIFEATTYPCIVIARKGSSVASDQVRTLNVSTKTELVKFANNVNEHALKRFQSEFWNGFWRLEDEKILLLITKIQKAGKPLSEVVNGKIYAGIKTGFNDAFIIDAKTRDMLVAEDKSSADLIKPLIKGKDADKWSCKVGNRFIIFTSHGTHINDYPVIKKYLSKFKNDLENRALDQKWFELQQPQIAFTKEFEMTKIVYPNVALGCRFSLDTGSYLDMTTFCICSVDLKLLAILNSSVINFYFAFLGIQRRGGYQEFKTQYVKGLPIPVVPFEKEKPMEQLVKQILSAKQHDADADVSTLELEINELVYRLYGLTPEEIQIIEKSLFQ